MKVKRILSLPVLAVFSLMAFVYYITIFVLIEDWVALRSFPGTLNASIFTLLAFLCLFSFVVSVVTDPGHVPSSYFPDVEGRGITGQVNGKDSLELLRCDKCFTYKPPRTHHCRVCRRCVLKMDHHCKWINNCVGYWNYKAFFVLAFYSTLASIHSTMIFISCVLQKDWESFKGTTLKKYYVQPDKWGVIGVCGRNNGGPERTDTKVHSLTYGPNAIVKGQVLSEKIPNRQMKQCTYNTFKQSSD